MASGSATPSAQAKANKVRSLLASYYDDDGSETASTPVAPRWPCKRVLGSGRALWTSGPPPNHYPPAPAPCSPVAWTPTPQPPSLAPGRADSTPLNTSYFDPDAYLRRLLKEARLGELASKARS